MQRKNINEFPFISYSKTTYDISEMTNRCQLFFEWLDKRRTVRDISDKPIPEHIIETIIRSASTAPSGAHKQPWTFCVVKNPEIKKQKFITELCSGKWTIRACSLNSTELNLTKGLFSPAYFQFIPVHL